MIAHHAKQTLIKEELRLQGPARVKCAHNIGGRMLRILYSYARNRAKSALKRGVGLYEIMGV